MKEIVYDIVCERCGVDIKKRSRERKYVYPRMIFIKIMRLYSYSYPEIGKFLGMHHSSIIYANESFDIIFPQDYDLRVKYNEIEKKVIGVERSNNLQDLTYKIKSLQNQLKDLKLELLTQQNTKCQD
jgi:hypothetical protein